MLVFHTKTQQKSYQIVHQTRQSHQMKKNTDNSLKSKFFFNLSQLQIYSRPKSVKNAFLADYRPAPWLQLIVNYPLA